MALRYNAEKAGMGPAFPNIVANLLPIPAHRLADEAAEDAPGRGEGAAFQLHGAAIGLAILGIEGFAAPLILAGWHHVVEHFLANIGLIVRIFDPGDIAAKRRAARPDLHFRFAIIAQPQAGHVISFSRRSECNTQKHCHRYVNYICFQWSCLHLAHCGYPSRHGWMTRASSLRLPHEFVRMACPEGNCRNPGCFTAYALPVLRACLFCRRFALDALRATG